MNDPYRNVDFQASMISKYNYVGVPQVSKTDERLQPVQTRKKLRQEQQAFEQYNGCNKFANKQAVHH